MPKIKGDYVLARKKAGLKTGWKNECLYDHLSFQGALYRRAGVPAILI